MLTESQMCLRVDVQRALECLAEEERFLLWATLELECTLDDVGRALGCSRDRCFRVLNRAMAHLRRKLRCYATQAGKTEARYRWRTSVRISR